jgi:hypothetical protein
MLRNNKNVIAGSVIFTTLTACGGGGGGSSSPAAPAFSPTPAGNNNTVVTTPVDNRHHFETFSIERVPNTAGYSDTVTQRYSVTEHTTTGLPADTENYTIADYGFFNVDVIGTHPGFDWFEESQGPGTFWQGSTVHRGEINGDGFEDFYVTINVGHDKLSFKPGDYVFAFLNDGDGNFILSTDIFPDGIPCMRGSAEDCNDSEHLKSVVVADFNGDGLDDFYQGTTLLLSDNGYFYDKRDTNLPIDLFEQFARGENNGMGWTHDAHGADIDSDGDIDIFIPYSSPMKDGSLPKWVVLVNDGTGNFSANTNFPEQPRNLLATAAVVGDFDNDGYGDIAFGWFDTVESKQFGFSTQTTQSSGIILWNDGNGNWDTRDWTELPDGIYGSNNNANDIQTIDFNNDGLMDIVLASTKKEPYYDGRAVQFFMNNGDETFTDVTDTVSPGNDKYFNGLDNGYWNGDGYLSIMDFDADGDLDIVDSSRGTYVLLNNNGEFELFDDFPNFREDSVLYPVDINSTGTYDFVGYEENVNNLTDTSTITYFQVLDFF